MTINVATLLIFDIFIHRNRHEIDLRVPSDTPRNCVVNDTAKIVGKGTWFSRL